MFRVEVLRAARVVLVTVGDLAALDVDAYEAAYRAAYAELHHFVLVFDVRDVQNLGAGLPKLQRKVRLVMDLKPRTVRQAVAVVVLVRGTLLQQLVPLLARAGGQVAPLHVFASEPEAVAKIAELSVLLVAGRLRGPRPLWRDLDAAGVVSVLVASLLLAALPAHRRFG